MGKRLSKSTAKGNQGEMFVQSWVAEVEGVTLVPQTNAPSIDGQIQLYDANIDANLYLGFQVKCGKSYIRKQKANSKQVFLKLKGDDILNWQKANVPVVIIWVSDDPPDRRYALWTEAARAKQGRTHVKISRRSLLDAKALPSLLEIARVHAGFPSIPKLSNIPLFPIRVSAIKANARSFYSEWRLEGSLSPLFGNVDITLRAWRHMTRASSSQRAICHKLSLLPLARETVEKSTRARFLRVLPEDNRPNRTKLSAHENFRLRYSFGESRRLRRELYAVEGLYSCRYRASLTVEVVLEVIKLNNRILRAVVYGVHEKRS